MAFADLLLNLPLPVLNYWGYLIILLAAVLETFPLFGVAVPGMMIIILGGFFARTGVLDLGGVIFVAAAGAILGDLIGYLVGRRYGQQFISRYGRYFFFGKKNFEATKKMMRRHAGKTLIVGRFNSLTQALAPFVAGSTGILFPRFMAYNVAGGISWAAVFIMIGYLFGRSYEIASAYLGRFVFIALVISVLFAYTYRFINKKKHIFTKHTLYALILNIFSLYIFSKMVDDVVGKEFITSIDAVINADMSLLQAPLLSKTMMFITNVASPMHLLVLSLLLSGLLAYWKRWRSSLLLLFSMTGGVLFVALIKEILQRARPENALVKVSGYSFPSSHAATALLFSATLLYIFKDDIKNKAAQYIFILASILFALAVGFSRIYLNVHWFSDVIGGFSLGIFWLTLVIIGFIIASSLLEKRMRAVRKKLEKRIQKRTLQQKEMAAKK